MVEYGKTLSVIMGEVVYSIHALLLCDGFVSGTTYTATLYSSNLWSSTKEFP